MERPDAVGMTHTIRLRGFWEITSDGKLTTHGRNFGRPRTFGAEERVWLVCNLLPGPAEASVNGRVVGSITATGPFAADITDLVQHRNSVTFTVNSVQTLGEVMLEIRSSTS
jgi:hypothetical protein